MELNSLKISIHLHPLFLEALPNLASLPMLFTLGRSQGVPTYVTIAKWSSKLLLPFLLL
jgi:hypothetical protein